MCKFKVGDKVKTRNGTDVEILYINDELGHPIIGAITKPTGEINLSFWNADGLRSNNGLLCDMDIIPPSRTVTLYQALVRTMEGRYFSPEDLFSGLDDDGIEDWNEHGYKVVRLLTEYPIEVEL